MSSKRPHKSKKHSSDPAEPKPAKEEIMSSPGKKNLKNSSTTTNPDPASPKPKSKKPKESPAVAAEANDASGPVANGGDNSGGKLFQKFWTEGDEVTVLRGIMDFQSHTGRTPAFLDMAAFFDSIRASLHPQLTKDQVYNKIRSLKTKYVRGTGFNPSSASPHDRLLHELSVGIWGAQGKKPKVEDGGAEEQPASGGENGTGVVVDGDVGSVFPFLSSAVADYLKANKDLEGCLKLIDPVKAKALEEKFAHLWHGKLKAMGHRFDIYKEIALLLARSASSS